MLKELSTAMKDKAFITKDPIYVLAYLTKFKHACELPRSYEGATTSIFREFISGSALATMKGLLIVSSKDTDKHEDTVTSYSRTINWPSKSYATAAVAARSDEETSYFKQIQIMPSDFS